MMEDENGKPVVKLADALKINKMIFDTCSKRIAEKQKKFDKAANKAISNFRNGCD